MGSAQACPILLLSEGSGHMREEVEGDGVLESLEIPLGSLFVPVVKLLVCWLLVRVTTWVGLSHSERRQVAQVEAQGLCEQGWRSPLGSWSPSPWLSWCCRPFESVPPTTFPFTIEERVTGGREIKNIVQVSAKPEFKPKFASYSILCVLLSYHNSCQEKAWTCKK